MNFDELHNRMSALPPAKKVQILNIAFYEMQNQYEKGLSYNPSDFFSLIKLKIEKENAK